MSKRKRDTSKSPSNNFNNKKSKMEINNLNLTPDIDHEWFSATKTRNWMLKDPLIDWLNLYGEEKGFLPNSKTNTKLQNDLCFSTFIMNQGNKFEKYIVDILKEKFNEDFVTATTSLN